MNGEARSGWPVALGTAALCTAFLAFFTIFPQVADERGALPMARAMADSTLYPATDLLVTSGLKGPYHFYRMAGALYVAGANVDLWWYAILVASVFAMFVALWAIARPITGSAVVATIAVAIIAAASPYRGSVNWFLLPPPNLVVSTIATPGALAALALTLYGRAGPGLIVAALTFSVHPAMGLLTSGAIAAVMLLDPAMERARMLRWWALAFACAVPNAWRIVANAPANFGATTGPAALTFDEQFRLYADHAFIADHWRENYGWFLMQLGGFVALRRFIAIGARRTTVVLVSALIVFGLLFLANLYTVNYRGLTLTLALRGMGFVKALVFASIAGALAVWIRRSPSRMRPAAIAVAAILAAGALHKNLDIGEGFAAVAWGLFVFTASGLPLAPRLLTSAALGLAGTVQVLGQGWGILGVAQFSPEVMDTARLATITAAGLFLVGLPWWRGPEESPAELDSLAARGNARSLALGACVSVLAITLVMRGDPSRLKPTSLTTIQRRMQLATPDTALTDLVRWAEARSPAGSLFAVPPLDKRFTVFRLAAGRGVFALFDDVNQLSYDQQQYGNAHARLLAQGMTVLGRHKFEASGWDQLPAARVDAIARQGVDYAAFPAGPRKSQPLPYPVAYSDSRWIVYDLRSSR